jgi:hypothetical protein
MKPYGYSKRDCLCNRVGCCEQCRKGREGKRPLPFVREARKRARTEAKREIRENIN